MPCLPISVPGQSRYRDCILVSSYRISKQHTSQLFTAASSNIPRYYLVHYNSGHGPNIWTLDSVSVFRWKVLSWADKWS
jgi:hypothetical protein